MTTLQSIQSANNWQYRVNENFASLSVAALYGVDPATTTGLTLGYLGGNFNGFTPANGTVSITASSTNYVVAAKASGVVSVATNTTNWTNTAAYVQLYMVVAGASTMTTVMDFRQAFGAVVTASATWGGIGGTLSSQADLTAALASKAAAGIPQNSQSAAYTLILADANCHIYHPPADATARVWTIPDNSSVSFPIGTAVTFDNDIGAGAITIAITTDTLILVGAGTTGSRTLATGGQATALKVTATRWRIAGTGLT